MQDNHPVALGGMRLSTEPDRGDARAIAVLHAALDAGVTLLDTANAYCLTEDDRGHNERLIARALASWTGDRSSILVATKGGMTRPGGRWVPDGRAKSLIAGAEDSCRALGVSSLDLYQLHAPDPRIPLATSVRALADLQRRGIVRRIGLCNVSVSQIEEARRIAEIDVIQVEASLWHDEQFLSGVIRYCVDNNLRVLAYRPLAGRKSRHRVAGNPVLIAIAAECGATPVDVALAWLAGLPGCIIPLPGATTVASAQAMARYRALRLSDDQTAQLDELCPPARAIRNGTASVTARRAVRPDAEVALIMGLPGAGKSTIAKDLAARGYLRLNRDEMGGSLRALIPALDRALASGDARVVLDNTYVTRASRAAVIQAAAARNVGVRCLWLSTSLADAQVNVVTRILERYGRLLDVEELAARRRDDPSALAPTTLFRYQRELEPPDLSEGFSTVDIVAFERRRPTVQTGGAVIIWCDDVLLRSQSGGRFPADADDLDVDVGRAETLREHADRGCRLLGLSWQPEIAEGKRTRAEVDAIFAEMNERLGLSIEIEYCPHAAGPPRCWCRKPLPGLGVLLIHRHGLDPATCVYVADGPQDAGYAQRLGFPYRPASEVFA